jgi:hypothetical protein
MQRGLRMNENLSKAIGDLILLSANMLNKILELSLEITRLRRENIELKQYALELDRELQGRKQHHWN